MTFRVWDHLRCPATGEKLEKFDHFLWSNESEEWLYPELCETPILHTDPDTYLVREALAVSRAIAEFGEKRAPKEWFFNRFGRLNAADPTVVDTEVLGEGYPGFWNLEAWPTSILDLTERTPESRILDALLGRRFKKALDLGCGQGGMTYAMAEQASLVYGVEYQFYLAALANKLLQAEAIQVGLHNPKLGWVNYELPKARVHNAKVICAAIEALPFAEETFDWIHCGHVLDLVPDPFDCMQRITDLLKPQGILSICSPLDFPVVGHFDDLFDVICHRYNTLEQENDVPWVRPQHSRRYLLHQDWVWVGQRII